MIQTAIKVLITSVIIVLASELAKKWTFASALLLSIPLTSLLSIVWIYLETGDNEKVSQLSWGVFWLVPPSLVFFPVLSFLLSRGTHFSIALVSGIGAALVTYLVYAQVLSIFGIKF